MSRPRQPSHLSSRLSRIPCRRRALHPPCSRIDRPRRPFPRLKQTGTRSAGSGAIGDSRAAHRKGYRAAGDKAAGRGSAAGDGETQCRDHANPAICRRACLEFLAGCAHSIRLVHGSTGRVFRFRVESKPAPVLPAPERLALAEALAAKTTEPPRAKPPVAVLPPETVKPDVATTQTVLDPAFVRQLMQRGDALIALDDISGARRLYALAAQNNIREAALKPGYLNPDFLARHGVRERSLI